jgi:hypothetical protein
LEWLMAASKPCCAAKAARGRERSFSVVPPYRHMGDEAAAAAFDRLAQGAVGGRGFYAWTKLPQTCRAPARGVPLVGFLDTAPTQGLGIAGKCLNAGLELVRARYMRRPGCELHVEYKP